MTDEHSEETASHLPSESSPKTDGTGLPPVGTSLASRVVLGIAAFMVLFITCYASVIAWRLRPHPVKTANDAQSIALTVGEWYFEKETMRAAHVSVRCEKGAWMINGAASGKNDGWLVCVDSGTARIEFVKRIPTILKE